MTAFKILASGLMLVAAVGCTNFYEVPLETPLQPKLDTSRFQRILIAGFVTGGTDEVDTNLETARLLRSQLRTSSKLEIIDTEVIELRDVAELQADFVPPRREPESPSEAADSEDEGDGEEGENDELSEEDLEAYEHIFSDASYWRQLGEEYQSPLIITGTIHFSPHQVSAWCRVSVRCMTRSGAGESCPCAPIRIAGVSSSARGSSSLTAAPVRRSTQNGTAKRFSTTTSRTRRRSRHILSSWTD